MDQHFGQFTLTIPADRLPSEFRTTKHSKEIYMLYIHMNGVTANFLCLNPLWQFLVCVEIVFVFAWYTNSRVLQKWDYWIKVSTFYSKQQLQWCPMRDPAIFESWKTEVYEEEGELSLCAAHRQQDFARTLDQNAGIEPKRCKAGYQQSWSLAYPQLPSWGKYM